jgi:hypothetical protein
MPEVKCTVSNCQFWFEGNACSARQILITAGTAEGKNKFGQGAEQLAHTPVEMAEDCFCWTFYPRQSIGAEEEEEAEALMVPPLI